MSRVLRVIGWGESAGETGAVIGFGGSEVFRRKKEKMFIFHFQSVVE